jgi:ABC-type sugar transport system permease subunit
MSTSTTLKKLSRYREGLEWFATETWLGYGLILPATAMIAIIIVYPTVSGIYMSFFERSLLTLQQSTWIGLENYNEMFSDSSFWFALKNSVLLTAIAVSLEYLLGLGLAITLKQKLPGINFFRSIVMFPWVLPVIVIVIMFSWMLQPDFGVVNVVFDSLGLPTTYWFGDKEWAFAWIVVMHVWKNTPFFAVALMAGIQSIPNYLYEAAKIDGASALQQFRYITLPSISHISMIMIIIHVIFTFNNFDFVYLSTGGGPLDNTEVLATYIYKQGFETYALGYAASVGVTMLIIMLLFTIIYVKLEEVD